MAMNTANEAHAELGFRTLLVHAQYVEKDMSGGNIEGVVVDLLTSLMHLDQQYSANFDDMLRMAKVRFEAEGIQLHAVDNKPAKEPSRSASMSCG